jgi:hypothetical protein
MYHSPTEVVKKISNNRTYITMSADGWLWEAGKSLWTRNFTLDYESMPSGQPDKLVMLEDFRGGVDGRVWMACALSGEVCVIKFDHRNKKEELEKEAENWRLVWGVKDAQVIRLGERPALMMPYAKPIDNWDDVKVIEAVRLAVKTMVQKKLIHKDLARRHAGLFNGEVVFFDLRQVEEIGDESAAMGEMFKQLQIDSE